MGLRWGALLLGLALAACSPLRAVNLLVPESGFARVRAIAYGQEPLRQLDVYTPRAPSASARPVIVFFYGGGWQDGQRDEYVFAAEAFTAHGFVVVVPDYRKYPEVRYPAFVQDGARAVAWTVAHVGEYGGDPRRITLMGHSAGAHLAAMLAYNREVLDARSRAAVRAFVGLAGAYDFVPSEAPIREALTVDAGTEGAMPVRYVQGGEPPSLLVTGDQDTRVDPENTRRLARRLREAGSPVEEKHYPQLTHSTVLLGLASAFRNDALMQDIERFVRKANR
jgi:acetyl esterase/lipase